MCKGLQRTGNAFSEPYNVLLLMGVNDRNNDIQRAAGIDVMVQCETVRRKMLECRRPMNNSLKIRPRFSTAVAFEQ